MKAPNNIALLGCNIQRAHSKITLWDSRMVRNHIVNQILGISNVNKNVVEFHFWIRKCKNNLKDTLRTPKYKSRWTVILLGSELKRTFGQMTLLDSNT